jgi:hypothetical protein
MPAVHWNLLVYANAKGEAELQPVQRAIAQMRAALVTDQCNIVVQLNTEVASTRYWISVADKTKTEILPDVVNTSHLEALTSFLDAAHDTSEASSTALVLWGHGTGMDDIHEYLKAGGPITYERWAEARSEPLDLGDRRTPLALAGVSGPLPRWPSGFLEPHEFFARLADRVGSDPRTGEFLTNITLRQSIATSKRKRVELLGFDACWMATLEVAYELRSVADVHVGCQVFAEAWPYGAIVTALSAAPSQSAEQLARTIVASINSEITDGRRSDAVSAVRGGASLDALAAAFDTYARRVTTLIDSQWPALRKAVMIDAQRLDDPYQVDLGSLITVLGKGDPEAELAAASVAVKFDETVFDNIAAPTHPGLRGLSLFCPMLTTVDVVAAYEHAAFGTNSWAGFLVKFQHKLATSE